MKKLGFSKSENPTLLRPFGFSDWSILIATVYFIYQYPTQWPLIFAISLLTVLNIGSLETFDKVQEFYQYQYGVNSDGSVQDFDGRRYSLECRGTCQEYDHACRDFCTDSCKKRCDREYLYQRDVGNCRDRCKINTLIDPLVRKDRTCPGDLIRINNK